MQRVSRTMTDLLQGIGEIKRGATHSRETVAGLSRLCQQAA